jgi:serine/threonine protein kinase
MVEGVLNNESLAAIEAHVDSCEQCAAVIANLGALDSAGAKPRVVGRYQLDRRIGGGGMGEVWAAWDPQLRRDIAVKLVKPERADDGREAERLKREARALARLGHPNVLAVYDVGDIDGEVFIATELVVGDTLASRGGANADWRELVRLYAQAARGLAAAHDAGLVHRDIKPANLLIGTDGRVRVADFGLAVRSYTPSPVAPTEVAGHADERITQTGYIAGTPAYMAPEQRLGEPADARADQYALCVALAEGISGRRPPLDINAEAMVAFVGERRPREDDLDRVCAVIARGLSIVREERLPDMTQLANALEACLAPAPSTTKTPITTRRSRTLLIVGLAAAAGVATMLVVWQMRGEEPTSTPVATTPIDAPADATQTALATVPADATAMTVSRTTPAKITTPAIPASSDDAINAAVVGARRAMQKRDGAACIASLDKLTGTLASGNKYMTEVMRGQCEMLRGDCERGIQRIDAAEDAQGLPQNGKDFAVAFCPIEGPLAQRFDRLIQQVYQVTTPAVCKRYVAPAKAIADELTDSRHQAQLASALRQLGRCVGDCAIAESLWKRAHELDQLGIAWDVKNCAAPSTTSVPQVPPQVTLQAEVQAFTAATQKAQDAILRRDVKACRSFVTTPPSVPKGLETSYELVAGMCEMMTDCKTGTARVAKVQSNAAVVAMTYCPIAGTLDERIHMMRNQLSAFADMRIGSGRVEWCNAILPAAKQAAREVQTDEQRQHVAKVLNNVAWCISNAGRCGEANELVSLATTVDADVGPPKLSAKCP